MESLKDVDAQSLAVREWFSTGKALFVKAAQTGDLKTLQFIHFTFTGVVNCYHDGMTALNAACKEGQNQAVQWLLDTAEADIEKQDIDIAGYRAIHYAAKGNHNGILQRLIKKGAKLDSLCNDRENTALHLAIQYQSNECVCSLIEGGCDVNLENTAGYSPLLHATYIESFRIIEMLISSGRINYWNLYDAHGHTVFHLAVQKNNMRLIHYFLSKGGNELANHMLYEGWLDASYFSPEIERKVAQLLLEHLKASYGPDRFNALLEEKNISGMTPLLIACSNLDFCLVELLVEAGADVKAVNNNGDSACSLAALSSCVIDKKPSVESSPEIFKKMAVNPTHPLQAYLIGKGCSWEKKNNSGQTAAAILLENDCPVEVIEALNKLSVSSGSGCMGRTGCGQPLAYQLSCPCKPAFKVCSKCVTRIPEEDKCGCDEEEVVPIRIEIVDLD